MSVLVVVLIVCLDLNHTSFSCVHVIYFFCIRSTKVAELTFIIIK